MTSCLENKAREFAARAHEGQYRRYTGEPYIMHCANVADLVRAIGGSEAQIAAAWLHDVVEDQGVSLEEILITFGSEVAQLVENLTDISKPQDGNRAQRKEIDRIHSSQATPGGKTVKLADVCSNLNSLRTSLPLISRIDPGFPPMYTAEKKLLLKVLQDGDSILWNEAAGIVAELEWKLQQERV